MDMTQPTAKLAERAVLVDLTLSRWDAVANNHGVAAEVEDSKQARRGSTQVRQKLLPGCTPHEYVLTLFGALRNWHYERTLPWEDRGARLLGAAGVMGYMQEFRARRDEINAALEAFYAVYPVEQAKAQIRLGDLFNPKHYPSVGDIRQKFGVAIHTSPLPNSDDLRNFKGFTTEEVQEAIDSHETALKDRMLGAVQDMVTKLREPLEAMATRLADPDAVFRDTLVGNVATVLELMPALNILGDERIDALCAEARKVIHMPDTLRNNPDLRTETARKAAELAAELKGWM